MMENRQLSDRLQAAIRLYEIDLSSLVLLKSQSNIIYGNATKILQLTPTSYKSAQDLQLEVSWIEYLNNHGLAVVEIIRSGNGNALEVFDDCTLICYRRIIGEKLTPANWTASFFQQLGYFTGCMHTLGKLFSRETDFVAKSWLDIPKGRFVDYLPPTQTELVSLHDKLLAKLLSYPSDDDSYGLIHYDIHHENYLIDRNQHIRLFDFEMTCRSWYLNDISVILYYILNSVHPGIHADLTKLFCTSFWQGYSKVAPSIRLEMDKLFLFLLYRDLLVYGYTYKIWPHETALSPHQFKFRHKISESIIRRRSTIDL